LDIIEKSKLEERQRKAIDRLFDLLPERYETWNRRRKLRKILQDESAQKAQLFVIVAMNNYGLLMHRIQASLPGLAHRINNSSYFDPQAFLFDKCNALIYVGVDGQDSGNKVTDSTTSRVAVKDSKQQQPAKSLAKATGKKDSSPEGKKSSRSPAKNRNDRDPITEEKNNDYKDISDLLAGVISGLDQPISDKNSKTSKLLELQTLEVAKKAPSPLSPSDFTEVTTNIFDKFRYAVVIEHRAKQWTQLQNTCKLMFNCINSMLAYMPAMLFNNRKAYTLKDLCLSVQTTMYMAADNLLDMLFSAIPMEVIFLEFNFPTSSIT
jgi:hypothetical protein